MRLNPAHQDKLTGKPDSVKAQNKDVINPTANEIRAIKPPLSARRVSADRSAEKTACSLAKNGPPGRQFQRLPKHMRTYQPKER